MPVCWDAVAPAVALCVPATCVTGGLVVQWLILHMVHIVRSRAPVVTTVLVRHEVSTGHRFKAFAERGSYTCTLELAGHPVIFGAALPGVYRCEWPVKWKRHDTAALAAGFFAGLHRFVGLFKHFVPEVSAPRGSDVIRGAPIPTVVHPVRVWYLGCAVVTLQALAGQRGDRYQVHWQPFIKNAVAPAFTLGHTAAR